MVHGSTCALVVHPTRHDNPVICNAVGDTAKEHLSSLTLRGRIKEGSFEVHI